jgi:hypothetical protein
LPLLPLETRWPLNGIHSQRSTHDGFGLNVSKILTGSSPKTPSGNSGARSAQPLPMAGVAVPSLNGAVTASPACGIHSQGSKRGGSGLHVSQIAAGSSSKTPARDSGARSAQPLPMAGVAVPSLSGAVTGLHHRRLVVGCWPHPPRTLQLRQPALRGCNRRSGMADLLGWHPWTSRQDVIWWRVHPLVQKLLLLEKLQKMQQRG